METGSQTEVPLQEGTRFAENCQYLVLIHKVPFLMSDELGFVLFTVQALHPSGENRPKIRSHTLVFARLPEMTGGNPLSRVCGSATLRLAQRCRLGRPPNARKPTGFYVKIKPALDKGVFYVRAFQMAFYQT